MISPPLTESGLQKPPVSIGKRKTLLDETETGHPVKHRSSQACQSCRMRKVRCDVIVDGSCCTNCRLDHIECIVVASRRGKSNHIHHNSTSQTTNSLPSQPEKERSNSIPSMTKDNGWTSCETAYMPISPTSACHVPVCVTFDEDLDRTRAVNEATRDSTDHEPSRAYKGLRSLEPETNTLNQYHPPFGKVSLPAFITPLSSHIPKEDLDFLALKGAITVPAHNLCVEVLRGYLSSVHSFMPMLNSRKFIRAVLNNRENSHISLLLFQAVMFAGLHSLQLHVIHRLGFSSVKQARRIFFDRVRLLYEFEVETDSAAILQALLLMSSWYGKWDERRHTWHWTGLAYDVARSMGLHREPTTKHASNEMRRFRRRLWWSLYIRDRMIALGTRRPMRVRDADFDVAMLTLEDFDVEPLDESHQGRLLIPTAEENTSIALMCIELAKLCVCIGHVVSSQYTVLNTQPDVSHTMMVVSKRNGGDIQELEKCNEELNEWFQALERSVGRASSSTAQDGQQRCSEVHWAILNITYLTVVNVLHRAQALQPLPDTAEAQLAQTLSRFKVKDAARSLTKIAQNMLRHDQIRFLGPIGVTALLAACLSHMLDISSGNEDVRDASTLRLYQSLQVLQSLRGIYPSADAAASFLASIIRKAGIPVPAQVTAPAADFSLISATGHVRPTTGGNQSSAGKVPDGWPGEEWDVAVEQSSALDAGRQISPFQSLARSAHNHSQSQTLLSRDEQALTTRKVMQPNSKAATVSLSALAFTTPRDRSVARHGPIDMISNTPTTEHLIDRCADAAIGGLSTLATDGDIQEWNHGVDAGIDVESLAFNYDFYSDAFSFLDGPPQDI